MHEYLVQKASFRPSVYVCVSVVHFVHFDINAPAHSHTYITASFRFYLRVLPFDLPGIGGRGFGVL